MSARLLLEVTLRVLGLWALYAAISNVVRDVGFVLPSIWSSVPPSPSQMLGHVLASVAQFFLGAMLIWGAPWIAARFYPARGNDPEVHLNVGPGDVYRVACFVLGAYLLVQTAHPAYYLVAAVMRGAWNWNRGEVVGEGVTVVIYAAAGIILVFGSERIGRLVSHLRYDPDRIPKPQFTLLVLLMLMLFVGVVLALIRISTPGVR